MYDIKRINGHIEVYQGGEFLFSADTYDEAIAEIDREIDAERKS